VRRRIRPVFLLFRSLRHRNFRLFFMGQGISLIGTWMQMTAVAWLVWRMTHDPFLLGLVGFAARIPTFLFSPVAGVIVDRVDRRRLILAMQFLAMAQALTLALLTLTGRIEIWHVLVLSLMLGFVNTLDVPARQSFLVLMIRRRADLTNAIAMNSTMVNGARLIGPSVAGIMIAGVGEGLCFLLNGLSYVAVIAGLLMMRIPRRDSERQPMAMSEGLREGFRYARDFEPVRHLLLLAALVSLMGASYTQLLPIFSEQVLHGDARTQGWLLSAAAVGALAGALYLAGRKTVRGLETVIARAPLYFGAGLVVLAASRTLWLSLAVMPVIGIGLIVHMASTNTLLQTIVDDGKRGRVMSFYTMAFMGMVPLGSLLAGILADLVGAPLTVAAGGACCMAGGIAFHGRLARIRAIVSPAPGRPSQ